MKTKAQIVEELLKDGKITAEEAVILLTPDQPLYPVNPWPTNPYPSYPISPYWQQPYIITC